MMRDHYEGTPLALDNDPGMGPFEAPYRRPLLRAIALDEANPAGLRLQINQSSFAM